MEEKLEATSVAMKANEKMNKVSKMTDSLRGTEPLGSITQKSDPLPPSQPHVASLKDET